MPPLKHNQEGMTLVEILVVMFLFIFIATFSLNFLIMTVTGHAKAQANIEVQEHARLAMQRMVYEIRRAQALEPSSAFDTNLALSSVDTLALDMADADRDPTTFKVVNGILTLKQGADPAEELTSNDVEVTNLIFSDRSTANGRSHNLLINLTIKHHDPTGVDSLAVEYSLAASAELRDPN
ncbi:type II secretion system GspH family protein [Patescibacteria group bacterium]|nr:type II secretion system GspH family protein [Patescibacteria group bacterium]MBU1705308.1 type II secretion system GspH family protein [Patescibacteria group bacterium]